MKQVILFLLFIPCLALAQTQQPTPPKVNQSDKLTYQITNNPDRTFGYDIFKNGKLFVHQPTIPGRPGMAGFKTKADAEKVAKLVIGKIRKGIMPPTVEEKELKNLKI